MCPTEAAESRLSAQANADLYLDLLAKALTRALFEDNDRIIGRHTYHAATGWRRRAETRLGRLLARAHLELVRNVPYSAEVRRYGRDWPARAETMVGLERLANVRFCLESAVANGVPGDFIETGVWRGGTCIFARGVLKSLGASDRTVWLADSFAGLPPPDPGRYPADEGEDFTGDDLLSVSVEQVRHNFERYGLLDDQVRFLVGWFKDTLPSAPICTLAVLRLDGDLYQSTMEALLALYPKLSPGGYCIVDDYYTVRGCHQAIDDFRQESRITDPLVDIDGSGVFWRATGSAVRS